MRSLFLLVLLLIFFEAGDAVQGGPFTQLAPKQVSLSGSMASGQVFFYNFNGFTPGSCWGIQENATFDLLYGSFAENGTLITTGDYSVTGVVGDSGNIKLGVTGWADFQFNGDHTHSGSFNLNMNVSQKQTDTDSTFATSVQLPAGQKNYISSLLPVPSVFGSTCPGGGGDVDFVTFTLPVGACWSTLMVRDFDEIFGLFAPNGTILETADSSLDGVVDSTGKVTIAISGWDDYKFVGDHTYSGAYNLTILTATPGEQTDNTFATRNILAPGVNRVSGDLWAITGGSCQLGDVDFYEFNLSPGVCAQTSIVRDFDEVFGVFADNGTQLQYQDSQVTTKVAASGKLQIAISGWPDTSFKGQHSHTGTYNLTINTFQTTTDGNNVFANATQVDGAVTRSYISQLDPNQSPCTASGDVDFVTFSNLPVGNCFYTVMVRSFDEILGWYNSSGGLIQYQDNQIVGKVPGNGKVTIAVSGWPDSSFIGSHSYSGNYNLTIVTVAPTAPDGNDNFQNRTVLAAGVSSVTSDLAPLGAAPCNIVGDIDFFEFQVSSGTCFVTAINSTFDDMVGWVDSTNGSIFTVHDSSAVTGITPSNGKLVLAVTGYPDFSLTGSHSTSGNYTLSVTTATAPSDTTESPKAPLFVPGNTISSDLYKPVTGCGTADKDFWLFLVPAGSCFYTADNATFDEYLGAYFSNGTRFAAGDSLVSGFVPSDGVLIIGITGWPDTDFLGQHNYFGNYVLQVNTEVVTPDGDNTFQTRKVISNGTPASGSIQSYAHCTGAADVDFVTYTNLTPGACYQTQMVSNFSAGQYLLGRFADNGTLIDYTYSSYTDVVPASGQLTFAISGSYDYTFTGDHTSRGTYSLSLNVTIIPTVVDGNDNFSSATLLPSGQTTYSGDLFAVPSTPCTTGRKSDVDFIRFTYSPTCYVVASINATFDAILGYFNANGTLNTYTNYGTLPEFAVDGSGYITFAVTAWADTGFTGAHSGQGNYTVNLTTDCGNGPTGFRRVRGGGRSTSGNLASGAVDRWSFENQTAGACFVTNMDTSFDAVLGWYSDSASLILWDDYSITAIINSSGIVNIAVSGWPDTNFTGAHTNGGPYNLSLVITKNDPPPPSDGNDNFQQRVVVNGTQVSGSIWATIDQTPCPNDHNTVNDVDYYQFVGLPAGYCAATRMDENFDSAVVLLAANGTILDWEDYNIYTIVPSNGTLIIAVTGYPDRNLTGAHQKNGNYTLNIDLTHQQTAPAPDNNNKFATPTIVPANILTVNGSIWSLSDQTPCPNDFTPAGDVDFYRFGPLTPGYCFQTQISDNFDEYFGWYDNRGELIEDDDYQITGIVPADGFVYLAVTGYPDRGFVGNHNSNGNYSLTLRITHNAPPPASDGNDRFNSSTTLPSGQRSVSGSIWSTTDVTPCPNDDNKVMDVDFYTFQGLPAGSCFEADEDATFDEVLGLYNTSGGLVEWDDYTLLGVIPTSGILHIAVSGWADTSFKGDHHQNGNYTLRLSITRNDPPGETKDNDFAHRMVYNSNVRKVSGDIWYIRDRTPCPNDTPPSDVDFFTFTGLPAGTCFRTTTDTDFDTILAWYGDDGLLRTWSDNDVWGTIPKNGKVHLAMSGWADWYFVGDHTNGGRYSVSMILDPECGGYGSGSSGQSQWCGNNCAGKTCGSNGCGGSCGDCGAGLYCLYEGTCSATCDSICDSEDECGYDGCGGYCGYCSGSQDVCSSGYCVCVGDCTDRACGDDGCGGSCGTCSGSQEQCFDGVCLCVANCTGFECGGDGCGGICGVCGPYYTCGDSHYCVRDPLTQPSCDDYFGFPHSEVNLVLLNEVNDLLRGKIMETIDNLEMMRDALLAYNPDTQLLDLASLIDQIHLFCSGPYHNDTCLSVSEFEFIETAFLNAIHHVTIDPLSECAGRVCGTTSYGGYCGMCPPGQMCTEDGQCVCSYSCEGRTCGNAFQENGTSLSLCPPKSCGTCQDRYQCTSYQCTQIPHSPVRLGITDCANGSPINVTGEIALWQNASGIQVFAFDPASPTPMWNPEHQEGYWNFSVSAIGYVSLDELIFVEWETTSIDFCLKRVTLPVLFEDSVTGDSIPTSCDVSYSIGSLNFKTTTPPNPWTLTIPDYGYGLYSFEVACVGWDPKNTTSDIEQNTTGVVIKLQRTPIMLMIIDCESNVALGVPQTILINSTFNQYSTSFDISPANSSAWVPPSIGTYDFALSALGYVSAGESREIQYNTSSLSFCLSRYTFLVSVRDVNGKAYVTTACTVTWTPPVGNASTSITPPNPFQIALPDYGFGDWSFNTVCSGYILSTSKAQISTNTSVVELYVSRPFNVSVRDSGSKNLVTNNCTVQSTPPSGNTVSTTTPPNPFQLGVPDSGFGNWTFQTDCIGYVAKNSVIQVSASTTGVDIYLLRPINVAIRETNDNALVAGNCTIVATPPVGNASTTTTPPNPFQLAIPDTSYGTWKFLTSCVGYLDRTTTSTINENVTEIDIFVSRPVPVSVRDSNTNSILTTNCTVSWVPAVGAPGSIHTPPNPFNLVVDETSFGNWSFTTVCPGYLDRTTPVVVLANTTAIDLYVLHPSIVLTVREKYGSQRVITVPATLQISLGTQYNQTFSWIPTGTNNWAPPATGNWTFVTSANGYSTSSSVQTVTSSTSSITLYVYGCGDGVCSDGETMDFCPNDCAGLSLQFERYDSTSPVTGYTVSIYANNPRTDGSTGPVPNNEPVVSTKTLPTSSNVILFSSFNRNQTVYLKVTATGYIDFYWNADMSKFDPTMGQFYTLRGHLSPLFTSSNLAYRVVNTWRTTDNEPPPYAPTDLNLHLFFQNGAACDINNQNVTQGQNLIAHSISDSKQSGGPAAIEFDLQSGANITIWNSKPPRSSVIAPSQTGRYLINSGSYVVFYGVTSDAATGKQLGQVLLENTLKVVTPSNSFDIWRIADVSTSQPRQSGLTITSKNYLGTSTIASDGSHNMFFDCQIHPSCSQFLVPYADTGR